MFNRFNLYWFNFYLNCLKIVHMPNSTPEFAIGIFMTSFNYVTFEQFVIVAVRRLHFAGCKLHCDIYQSNMSTIKLSRRSANYSKAELNCLVKYLEENPELVSVKLGGKYQTADDFRLAWEELADKISAVGGM